MSGDRVLRWAGPAQNDLVAAHTCLLERNVTAAAEFADRVLEAISTLPRLPRRGPLLELPLEGEYRSIIIGYYRIVYRLDEEVIFIMRVWDCRQDPAGMLEELERSHQR